MNVSSVKNLNGETFSAVQDAYLTDVVSSNSANWNEVSAKLDTTAFSDVSGTFLTAHQDLSDYQTTADMVNYQTTAGMTAYQPTGDYLTTADSANFYTTANESGFISEVPAGTMNESAFSYDASDNITAYNGSAFKAGDEFPQSATEAIETVTANSADWNGTTDTVSSNSGAWGGSALPISAGPGIKVNIVDNTLVFSNDETVLFETTDVYGAGVCNLSESLKNFEHIAVLPTRGYTGTPNPGGAGPWNYFDTDQIVGGTTEPFQAVCPYIMEYINWKISQYNPNADCTVLTWNRGFQKNMQDNGFFTADSFTACVGIQKVIGINRKAGE